MYTVILFKSFIHYFFILLSTVFNLLLAFVYCCVRLWSNCQIVFIVKAAWLWLEKSCWKTVDLQDLSYDNITLTEIYFIFFLSFHLTRKWALCLHLMILMSEVGACNFSWFQHQPKWVSDWHHSLCKNTNAQ